MKKLLFDVETCETPRLDNGQLDVENGQVYDFGGMVIDDDGADYEKVSLVNKDVFFGMKESMKNAYYAEKIPQYMQDIWAKEKEVVNTWEMWKRINQIIKENDIKAIIGHNVWFDIRTLNATMRYQTQSRKRFFFPYGIEVIDTMKLARQTFAKDDEYIQYCMQNGYMTNFKKPTPRVTAEILYRFLSGNNDFCEEHIGLADVDIERKIYAECVKRMGV